jgi:hypothetical protein
VLKDHLFRVYTLNLFEPVDHRSTCRSVAKQFEQYQSPWRAETVIHMVQADARLDVAAVFRQHLLDIRGVLDPIGNMNPDNVMIFHARGSFRENWLFR